MDKGEIYKVSELETSTRLGNRDISLTPFTEIAMEKISLGEDGQMLFLVFEVQTEYPWENVYQVIGIMKQKKAQSQKNKLGVMYVENDGLKPQSLVILPGGNIKGKKKGWNSVNKSPLPVINLSLN